MGIAELLNLQKTDRKAFEKELKKYPLLKNAFKARLQIFNHPGFRIDKPALSRCE